MFNKESLRIYATRAIFQKDTLYDAAADLRALRQREKTEDCKVDYSFYYHPLSLIGAYYSYEFGKGGILDCGVPGNSLGIRTIDLHTKKEISLTELFDEAGILKSLKSDGWVQRQAKERQLDFSKYDDFNQLLAAINQLGHVVFSPSSFTILGYSETKNEVTVRWVGKAAMGFNHYQHLQLGLRLVPKTSFKEVLLNKTTFVLGKFENGLTE